MAKKIAVTPMYFIIFDKYRLLNEILSAEDSSE